MLSVTVASFYAEVFSAEGPTGEIVFADGAILEDYGGNKIAGPFTNPASALKAKKKCRVPSRFKAFRPHRIKGDRPETHPDFPSVACSPVMASEVADRMNPRD